MIAEHCSTEDTAASRGFAFGKAHADAVRGTVAAYERLFGALHGLTAAELDGIGERVAVEVTRSEPELIEEVAAIAEGAGVSPNRLVAVNARTEIFAGAARPECSVVGVHGGRSATGPLLAQNWDWHPDLAESLVAWTVAEADGSRFTTLTEAGILAKIGLNDRGLALALNILGCSLDGGVRGMPIHLLLRSVLRTCGSLDEVESLLKGQSASASSALSVAVAEAAGDSLASFEVSPAGVARIDADDGVLLHTNHFLCPPDGARDLYLRAWPDTVRRLDELRNRFAGKARTGPGEAQEALRSHEAGEIAICCHDPDNERYVDRQETLASVLMLPREGRMIVAAGPPCRAPYRDVGSVLRNS